MEEVEGTEELSKGIQLFVNMQLHENTIWICVAEDLWRLEEQNLLSFCSFSSPDLCNGMQNFCLYLVSLLQV